MIEAGQIWRIYGTEYTEMTKELLVRTDLEAVIREKADRAGENCQDRTDGGRSICIGIKPNLVCPVPAQLGATTHPAVVAGIIEYLQERGYRNIRILEGSWVGDRTEDAYELCGYRELCEKYGVLFVDTQKAKWHTADCGGISMQITDAVDAVDFLINVPVLKGHCQTKVTCALKNMKGLLTNSEKRHFHRLGLHRPIALLGTVVHSDFIVTDHICGDPDFEEGGNPVVRNCVMASLDPVLTDSFACFLLHYTADDVEYIRLAEKMGVGSADLTQAQIVTLRRKTDERGSGEISSEGSGTGESSSEGSGTGESGSEGSSTGKRGSAGSASEGSGSERSSTGERGSAGNASEGSSTEESSTEQRGSWGSSSEKSASGEIKFRTDISGAGTGRAIERAPEEEKPGERRILDVSYAVEDVDSCSACYGNLIPALYRLKEEGLLEKFHEKIAIGQGQPRKTGRLGVGRCTKNFDICVMGCPPDEETIYRELRDFILFHPR